MSPFSAGMTLHDRFTLVERIGLGGMSEVWRADDRVLGRPVAVKALVVQLAADPLLRAATWREAHAAARLNHPHVTQVYDYGEAPLPGGGVLPYLVMELVDGDSLADRLRTGPLPWAGAMRMGAQVAAALAAAHRLGIVHRDVKPGNVMLTRAGAKVLDFGIAALAGGGPDTDRGRLVGTPAYAAPERLLAAPAAPASDVYALGVLLYEALTGYPPVPAASWREAEAGHLAGAPLPSLDVPGLPRRVARLCLSCLDPDPADRPTADDLAAGLAATAAQQPGGTAAHQPAATTVLPMVGAGPPADRYAVGSAPLPHPPTLIEPAADPTGPSEAAPRARSPRPLLLGLIGAVVLLVFALVAVTTALLSSPAWRTAAPGTSAAAPPPSPLTSSSSSSPSSTSGTVVDQLDQAITDAVAAGQIDPDAAQRLRDKLQDLRDGIGRGRARKQAQELKKTISELLDDEKIDQATADHLTTLLDSYLGSG